MKKFSKVLLCTTAFLMLGGITSFAGEWKSGTKGWWYDNGDGTWPANEWQWIDGNGDGVSECYYFDQDGWLLTNTTTPDHYQVDGNGAWTVDGQIQQKKSEVQEDMGWVDAYANILTNYKNPVGLGTTQFQLIYLNEDSIPELSIHCSSVWHHQGADLYTYYNGQAVHLGEFGNWCSFSYREKQNRLFFSDAASGVETNSFYQLKDGVMIPINLYEAVMDFKGEDYVLVSCYKNNKTISESEYRSSLAADLGDESTYKSAPAEDILNITPANIKKMKEDVNFAIR